ncbi:MAG: hypothetical protein IAF94_20740 [Pirellulaceae bacterium]|nr:hypothetical protein [Pirellulaceae bacterium]
MIQVSSGCKIAATEAIFSAAQGVSFAEVAEALAELGELKLLPKRIWRAAQRIGEERVEECRAAAAKYEQLSLPARRHNPVEQVPRAGETGSQRLAGEPGASESATGDDVLLSVRSAKLLASRIARLHVRHIQHHAAQFILRLRLDTEVEIPWIGAGWRKPQT